MLVQVPEWGTGKRAKLDGIRTAGKTGTTSAYRDAWFVGFTGNYTAAVWFGNDGYAPTRRLTGGILPAHGLEAVHDIRPSGRRVEADPVHRSTHRDPAGRDGGRRKSAKPSTSSAHGPQASRPQPANADGDRGALMRKAAGLKPLAALVALRANNL